MKQRILTAMAVLAVLTVGSAPALADPPPHPAAKKMGQHPGTAVLRGANLQRYAGGPPPWAPAHGYRRKAGWYDNQGWRDYGLPAPPLDLSAGTCNREVLGQVIGGGLGAVVGSQVGGGDGRLVAIAAGTIIGVLVGGEVGRAMDRQDALCVDQALESAPDGDTIVWNSGRESYRVTPTQTAQVEDGRYCREYRAESTVDGRDTQVFGTACRQSDGSWQIVN
jgi:surface antigen